MSKKIFRDELKAISEIDQPLRFCLCLELTRQYEMEMDNETASVLAVQVCNHLMGDDFIKVYDSLTEEVQKKVDAIEGLIGTKVAEAMTENKVVRELIIRHIMTTYCIYGCLFDKAWFEKPEMKNREKLIREYGSDGSEFCDVVNFERYMACASNFIDTRLQKHEQGSLKSNNNGVHAIITNLRINNVPFALKEKLNRTKLSTAKCKKAGFLWRIASRARKSETLYWSKNCEVSCFGKPVVWPKLDTKFSNLMCGTSAFLYYSNSGLAKITFQIFGDEVMAMGCLFSFVDLCKQEIGNPQTEMEFVISWEFNDTILRCRPGKKNKEAWFNLITKGM